MPELDNLLLYLVAALAIAVTPGPGIFYVAARTLAGGRREGLASSLGTGIGGMAHVLAGAVGVSALVLASAQAFAVLKIAGAVYLVWLGWKTYRSAATPLDLEIASTNAASALREGIAVEALNPKTALFFLAFIPQFVDPQAGSVALQFAILGTVSVLLNTLVDVGVAYGAARTRDGFARNPGLIRRVRQAAGAAIACLGLALAFARRPQ